MRLGHARPHSEKRIKTLSPIGIFIRLKHDPDEFAELKGDHEYSRHYTCRTCG
jgi:hypothetical protein